MTPATGLLLLGGISALATLCVLVRGARLGPLLVPFFFTAWLQGELAVYHLIWQSALAIWLASLGALESTPGQLGLLLLLLSFAGLARSLQLSRQAGAVFRQALAEGLGADYRAQVPPARRRVLRDDIDWREWMRPFSFRRPGVRVVKNLHYGPAGRRNLLDIYLPAEIREGGCPVLFQVHGGAWMISNKEQQALPLLNHMAQRGWVCVTINYRLSPRATFPEHIEDVKLALGWVKQNIARFGGDPGFVAITGGSAGGHLCSLAALTPNRPEFQPGFEHMDTSVQAALPYYGVYDWNDEAGCGGIEGLRSLLLKYVMKAGPEELPEAWLHGTSLSHIHADAPPMFMVHGDHDSLVWVEDARYFVARLREISRRPVLFAELPGAQHAFEIFHSIRCDYSLNAAAEFLEWAHADWARRAALPPGAAESLDRDAGPPVPGAAMADTAVS